MKKLSFIFVVITGLVLFSCKDGKEEPTHIVPESPFQLEEVYKSDPQTKVYYQSPDPGCGLPKDYDICAPFASSTLIMECKNYEEIHINYSESYCGEEIAKYELSDWARIEEGNRLVLDFPDLTDVDATVLNMNSTDTVLEIYAQGEDGMVRDAIVINRVPTVDW